MNLPQPVFICGALRSGSTLLHLMLDNHPNIKNPGEFDFMFDKVGDAGDLPEITDYRDFLTMNRIFKAKNLVIDESLNYQELLYSFVSQLSENNKVLALNIHRNFHRVLNLFGEAKFVHLLRDPRDVARSSIEMGWSGNVYFGVNHWIETELSWDKLATKLNPENFTTVYYEDLIADPESELKQLCSFMGLAYDSKMLDYHNHSTYKKPDKTLIQQWKKKLSEREIQYIESKAGFLMQQKRFEMSGLPLAKIDFVEKFKLKFQNKFYRVNFYIKRYGLYLYMLEKFTRLLRLAEPNKRFLTAQQEIDKKHLR